jgi:hypothetical protein
MSQFTTTQDEHGTSIVEAASQQTVIYQGRPMKALEEGEAEALVQSLEDADPAEWSTDPATVDIDLTLPS